jgi:hypothetical protein
MTDILATQSEVQRGNEPVGKKKNEKKRTRGYEGDEVFKISRDVILPTIQDGKVVLASVDGRFNFRIFYTPHLKAMTVLRILLRNPQLSSATHSISVRILLSILLTLPQMTPSSLSPDLTLHGLLCKKIELLCIELGSGTTSTMSKSLELVMGAILECGISKIVSEVSKVSSRIDQFNLQNEDTYRCFDLLVHPRVPPLVRTLPHVESLSLFRLEESQEEAQIRLSLGLGVNNQHAQPSEPIVNVASDDSMDAETTTIPPASSVFTGISHPSPADPPQDQDRSVPLAVPPCTPVIPVPDPTLNLIPPLKPETAAKTSILVTSDLPPVPLIPIESDEDDEEMPAIDLNSDSD